MVACPEGRGVIGSEGRLHLTAKSRRRKIGGAGRKAAAVAPRSIAERRRQRGRRYPFRSAPCGTSSHLPHANRNHTATERSSDHQSGVLQRPFICSSCGHLPPRTFTLAPPKWWGSSEHEFNELCQSRPLPIITPAGRRCCLFSVTSVPLSAACSVRLTGC